MTSNNLIDVLVVGAGPVGLTLAVSLARSGVTCRIIDQALVPHREIRAKALTPRTEEIFADLGVIDQIHAHGQRNLVMQFYEWDRIVRTVDPATDSGTYPTPDAPYRGVFWIGQHRTQAVLRKRLADWNIAVELDSQLIDVTQDTDHVTAQIIQAGNRETIHARYLVGCDGGHSTIRKRGGFAFQGETIEEEPYLNAGVRVSGLDPHSAHYWMHHPDGVLGFTPIDDTMWVFQARAGGHGDSPSLATCQQLFNERAALPGVQITELLWGSFHRSNARMVTHYRNERIFLAGDAAHVHSGAGGQGMNTGIGDAYNLGWKLAHVLHGAHDALLNTYEAERLPLAQALLASTTSRHQMYLHHQSDDGSSRLQAMFNTVVGRDAIADTTQLLIAYRGGPLARDLDNATGIRAGDRAPDAPVIVAAADTPSDLFDVFQGPHFTLLSFGDQPTPRIPDAYREILQAYAITRGGNAPISTERVLRDIDGYAHHFYGITDDALVLVRPDGYVGLTSRNCGFQPVIDYLHQITGR